jgi:type VI secretion system protein ImpH
MTLEGLLSDYWDDLSVRVDQFVGRWVALHPADLNRLGAVNSRLGGDLTVGDQVYDRAGAFTVQIGPVDWTMYLTFVPGGSRFKQTQALTRLYCCDPLAFSFTVTLCAAAVPETRLTLDDQAGRLGLTTWVRTADLGETSVTFSATGEPALGTAPNAKTAAK